MLVIAPSVFRGPLAFYLTYRFYCVYWHTTLGLCTRWMFTQFCLWTLGLHHCDCPPTFSLVIRSGGLEPPPGQEGDDLSET